MRVPGEPVTVLSAEVRDALASGAPVLALESTIFTHGLPRPRNLAVALDAVAQLRDAGVVAATVGVLDGVPVVGLDEAQIERLATEDVHKLSVRDLPVAVATRSSGGTTVASTAYLAQRAGIAVMSTGGLGGVHRGATTTFDESADLTTLASTPIAVVSAGVKSILDIGATLERLETLNIPVVGYRTNRYPAFYVADSGFSLEYRVDSPAAAADLIAARDALGLTAAVLIANPVAESKQLSPAVHDAALASAIAAAERDGVSGHDITPYLLDHMQRATGGASLDVNVEVYRRNVALGAEIARAVAERV